MGIREELTERGPALSVSIMAGDLMNLGASLRDVEASGGRIVHIDVMDGNFCPSVTLGSAFVAAMDTPMFKDVHLLIADPLSSIDDFVAAGADSVTVHLESTRYPLEVLRALGRIPRADDATEPVLRGIAVNPATPIDAVEPLLGHADIITLVAIDPGFSGQRFDPRTSQRVGRLRELIGLAETTTLIGIDGGVTRDNFAEVAAIGADLVVSGSAVLGGDGAAVNLPRMQEQLRTR